MTTDDPRDHPWPAEPLTSPVCPYCGRKERPHTTEESPSGQVVYECPECGRSWTMRHPDPKAMAKRVRRRRRQEPR
jgi:transposase-like protein